MTAMAIATSSSVIQLARPRLWKPEAKLSALCPPISTQAGIELLLAANQPVAIGVSGGKDSAACAYAVSAYLKSIGHSGPRLLIHSDLGRVEWADSLPSCQRLADALDMELAIVRRRAGDLMDRWLQRWNDNVARYADLLCVRLILPWSTPSMRFCTAELKRDIICRYLVERFASSVILSVCGIRREESPQRAKAAISSEQKKLTSKTFSTTGYDWNAILDWLLPDVWAYLTACKWAGHKAYSVYGSSRCSCVFCILGALADLIAGASCPENHDLYREMVAVEIVSTFSFQDTRWLADIRPDLLDSTARDRIADTKVRAARREAAEARIPKHLLYTKGWPTCIPSPGECGLLADVRAEVADAVGIDIHHRSPDAIRTRYEVLFEQARRKEAARS